MWVESDIVDELSPCNALEAAVKNEVCNGVLLYTAPMAGLDLALEYNILGMFSRTGLSPIPRNNTVRTVLVLHPYGLHKQTTF